MGYIELDVLDDRPKKIVIGIDLGTTNSLPALWNGDRPEILSVDGESGIVPSVVYFPEEGTPVVGHSARARAVVDPELSLIHI